MSKLFLIRWKQDDSPRPSVLGEGWNCVDPERVFISRSLLRAAAILLLSIGLSKASHAQPLGLEITGIDGGIIDVSNPYDDEPYIVVWVTNHSLRPVTLLKRTKVLQQGRLSLLLTDHTTGDVREIGLGSWHDPDDYEQAQFTTLAAGEREFFRAEFGRSDTHPAEPDDGKEYSFSARLDHQQPGDPSAWEGVLESEPIRVRFGAPDLDTPFDFLEKGYTVAALKSLKRDRFWISRRTDKGFSMLVEACTADDLKIVDWLIENGAEVEGTALQNTKSLAVFQRVLPHVPKDWLSNHGAYLLSGIAVEMRGWPGKEAEYREKIQLLLAAGVSMTMEAAIALNDIGFVKKALEDPNRRDQYQYWLTEAARRGRLEVCKLLIEAGVDLGYNDSNTLVASSALHHPEVLRLFIDSGAQIDGPVERRQGPGWGRMLDHLYETDSESAALLMYAGASPLELTQTNDRRWVTTLEQRALYSNEKVLLAILNHPKFQSHKTPETRQALQRTLAAACKSILPDAVSALIRAGADPTWRDEDGRSLMILAARELKGPTTKGKRRKLMRTIDILQESGVPLDLFSAISSDSSEKVASVLANDPQAANEYTETGDSMLQRAVAFGNPQIVAQLLTHTDVNRFGYGRALHDAAFDGFEAIAELLIEHGADVNAQDEHGWTPLHLALQGDQTWGCTQGAVRLLLRRGASLKIRDKDGKTPGAFAAPEMLRLITGD